MQLVYSVFLLKIGNIGSKKNSKKLSLPILTKQICLGHGLGLVLMGEAPKQTLKHS